MVLKLEKIIDIYYNWEYL